MVRIAIVEDEIAAANKLIGFIDEFFADREEKVAVSHFDKGVQFLSKYDSSYDIIFMDIEMPNMNGLELSAEIRKLDKMVTLVFVTNMAQLAVRGYEVNAFDFIVKPVTYTNFKAKLLRALENAKNKGEFKVAISTSNGVECVNVSDIKFIEVMNHKLIYHTFSRQIEAYGQLKQVEDILQERGFIRCNNCYLVNMRYVVRVEGFTAIIGNGEDKLSISHLRKKSFLKGLTDFLGGVNS